MTNRDRTYRALREAGEAGITRANLREAVGAPTTPHVESLRHEGHLIDDTTFRTDRARVWGYRLARDVWAEAA